MHAIRRVKRWVNNDDAVNKLLNDYAERFRTRPGGYTRVVKLSRRRPGDNAPMAVIELVESMDTAAASSSSAAEE